MPEARADDGCRLWFDEVGDGPAVVFVHEFGGEPASWDHQVTDLAVDHRCIRQHRQGRTGLGDHHIQLRVRAVGLLKIAFRGRADTNGAIDHLSGVKEVHVPADLAKIFDAETGQAIKL